MGVYIHCVSESYSWSVDSSYSHKYKIVIFTLSVGNCPLSYWRAWWIKFQLFFSVHMCLFFHLDICRLLQFLRQHVLSHSHESLHYLYIRIYAIAWTTVKIASTKNCLLIKTRINILAKILRKMLLRNWVKWIVWCEHNLRLTINSERRSCNTIFRSRQTTGRSDIFNFPIKTNCKVTLATLSFSVGWNNDALFRVTFRKKAF